MLEDHVARVLRGSAVGERMDAEGAVRHGIALRVSGAGAGSTSRR
jgi:hypothetical protein